MVCVDTSFLVSLERQEAGAIEKLRELVDRGEVVYITTISVAECYLGAFGSRDRTKALGDVTELLDLFSVLSLDFESGRMWGELADSMRSESIGDRDLFIASIAKVNGQSLVTGNRRHFDRVPGLVVENW